MAKKLLVGNYRFDASEQVVYISGNYAPEKFLIITNITSNTIIYNFADPTLGFAGKFYDVDDDETAFSLVYDTTSMNDADILQVFIDQDYTEITPSEDMLDPVGKMRVSNPENLIDTDFEYGLQATKWETTQTVNNIPTIYSNTGDTPVDRISKVEAINGSKNIKVTTALAHGLTIGDPISVQGLSQYQAEGFFIVTSVPDTLTFFFELDVIANFSGDISGSYTTIVPGKFFEGSTLPVSTADGAQTNGATPSSTITVTTKETHGLTENTKVYLRNTVGPRILEIADSTLTAPDGRPFVDTTDSFSISDTIDQTSNTGRGTYADRPVTTYDWESTYTKYIDTSEWDTTNDTVTWNNHGLRDGYCLLYNTPYQGFNDGGINDGEVFFVDVIDDNTIKLSTNDALTSPANLTTLSNTYGLARLGLVYKVESTNGTTRQTEFYKANESSSVGQTSAYQSSLTSVVSFNVDVTTALGGNPTAVTIQDILAGGDINSTSEWLEFTIAGITQRIYGPGNQSWSLLATAQTNGATPSFNNLDVSSFLTTSGGRTFLPVTVQANGSVGGFTSPNGSDRYRFVLNLINNTPAGSFTEDEKKFSGGDLADAQYGLGASQPSAVIGFQGRTSGSYTATGEDFTYLINQRNNGRYGTLGVKYNNIVTVESGQNGTGQFSINVTDASANYGTASEIFYIFANPLTSDRNTIYLQDHGIDGTQVVTITVDSTRYSAGDRFGFGSSNGAITNMAQTFTATASVVNQDVIRITTELSPNTDDIARVPTDFTMSYTKTNVSFNTVYISNHKITADSNAVYNNTSGTAIPPLTNNQSVVLTRIDDSRVKVGNGIVGASASAQVVTARSNNSTITDFIDLEAAFGFVPGTAQIDRVEFRGDFSASSEYVTVSFDDGDSYRIGQSDDIGDSATYTDSTTLTFKDLSNVLITDGNGNRGFNITVNPQAAVNYGPGGGPWWGLRITYSGSSSGLLLTGTGSGGHEFEVTNLVGAYDGVFNMTSVPSPNTFTMTSDFQIPTRTYQFTNTDVNNASNTITTSSQHNLVTGEKVAYNDGGNTSILPAGVTDTFAIVTGADTFKIATSAADALGNLPIDITGQTGTHTFTASNVIKNIAGTGTLSMTSGNKNVVGSGTNFLATFKKFDKIYINTGVFVTELTVDTVTTQENLTIFEAAPSSVSGTDYYYATQLSLRPDGFSLHKPFDGGVDITAGTSPNSKISRQTRKYFRYQSGKGLQTSFAINFNPPRIVRELIKASGTTATVKTQEQHNLKVGDSITIRGAVVNTGTNYYNGSFPVVSVPDPFTFTYTMAGAPGEVKASGFPSYVRDEWTDSFVRGGMFDDQNGFFFEFDGQKLYAVRRSSTTQIAGFVSIQRNSQIVNGVNSSFTTQLNAGDNIVIRGQSYLITEVSSDIRMVVQPAYRGIDAENVKCTKTIDTRTPQDKWNMDKADGTGFTGYILDITKIQMAYMDYSWYGAGKIRYGFKDRVGHIRYFHEYRHNNVLDESYFRSGNLPARYEIKNGPAATTAPTLFHFGTSIIMDGTFDDDRAYQFTGQSKPFAFTNGASRTLSSTATSTFEQITLNGTRVYVYAIQVSESDATATAVGSTIAQSAGNDLVSGTYVTQVKIAGASSIIYTSWPATSADPTGGSLYNAIAASSFVVGETSAVDLSRPIPLISVRLAPSVDSGLTGALGEREIINRMQLRLRQASITANTDIEFFLLQNSLPSTILYENAQSPSLSEVIKHSSGDTLLNGTAIYSAKASTGSTVVDLTDLLEIGNSILGGDGIFPAGPDLLTLAVQPQSTTGITQSNPFIVNGKISWSESQA